MPNGKHRCWAMSRPLVEPICSRYLQDQRFDHDEADAGLLERLRLGRLEDIVRQQRREQTRIANFGLNC